MESLGPFRALGIFVRPRFLASRSHEFNSGSFTKLSHGVDRNDSLAMMSRKRNQLQAELQRQDTAAYNLVMRHSASDRLS